MDTILMFYQDHATGGRSAQCGKSDIVDTKVVQVHLAKCNGVPTLHDKLHDNLHKVNIKYEYCVRTNTIFSQYIAK